MKDIIIKISVHLFVIGFLTNLGLLINHLGGQAILPDRCVQMNFR